MAEVEDRRPKRRCARVKNAVPSAVHYVGYVEDEETPEMIMKKFEELETIRAAATAGIATAAAQEEAEEVAGTAGEGAATEEEVALTEEQLMEVFKQTSTFNVRTAMANNDLMVEGEHGLDDSERFWDDDDGSGDDESYGYMRGFWSDEDEDQPGQRKMRGKKGERLPRKASASRAAKPRTEIRTHYNANTQAIIRRKVKIVDRDAVYQVRVPNLPLPLSWGRTVLPYVPPHACLPPTDAEEDEGQPPEQRCVYMEQSDVAQLDVTNKALNREFQAALINEGWEGEAGPCGTAAASALARLPLPRLVPRGFVFIFVRKEHIAKVMRQMVHLWRYQYVENLTWVMMGPNNRIVTTPSPFIRTNHITLLIFRKQDVGKDIELRHQRSPDACFSCIRTVPGQAYGVPDEAIAALETMLPSGPGKFLELWGRLNVKRPGWTHIVRKLS